MLIVSLPSVKGATICDLYLPLFMKRIGKIKVVLVVSLAIFFVATGCYEPSEYTAFDEGEQVVVIEGLVTDVDSVSAVYVTRTVSSKDTADCEHINNAVVFLRDDKGNSAELENVGDGTYLTDGIVGEVGGRYLLTVEVDGERYSAIDAMPTRISVDSVVVEYQNSYTYFDTIGYYVSIYSKQNSDTLQYYRVEVELNGEVLNGYSELWLFEDAHLADVCKMTIPRNFSQGDSVVMGIYSLSASAYEYYSGLSKQFVSNFSNIQPPLTNPENNIRRALGYFQASSVVRIGFVVSSSNHMVLK